MGSSGVIKTQGKIEQLQNQLDRLKQKQNEVNKGWDGGSSGLTNLLNKVKRIGLALMGARTAMTAIRKAMSTYLAQNDALRKKLDGIWYALGSMFAPIVEWLVNLFAKLVLYLNAFLKGLGLAGISFGNIANSAQKTQKNMKKLISGFDELNVYSKDSQDTEGFVNPFADVEVNQEWIDRLTKLGETLRPIFEWLRETLSNLFKWITDHIGLVIGALVAIKAIGLIAKAIELWNTLKIIFEGVKTFLATSGLGTLLTTIGGIVLAVGGIGLAVYETVDMWKNGWNIVGEILKDLGLAIAAVGAIILGAPATVAAIVAGVAAVLSTLVVVVHEHWDEIVEWTKKLWKSLGELWDEIAATAKEAWGKFCDGIVEVVTLLGESLGILWNDTKELAKNVWRALKEDVTWIVTELSQKLSSLWNSIKTVFSQTMSNIASIASTVWNAIKTTLVNIGTSIGNFFTNLWNGIKNTVTTINTNIGTFIKNTWSTIATAVTNFNTSIANGVKNIWNGIVNVIKGAINGIIGFINGMIRGVVNGINAVIGVLNRFNIRIPDWVPGYGGRRFGFNIGTLSAPQIPTLAQGGILTSPTLAMLGEYAGANNNPEIATPQSLLEDIIDRRNGELVRSFAQMTNQIISAIGDVDMSVSIGDDVIAKSASRGNNSYKMMTGKSLFAM